MAYFCNGKQGICPQDKSDKIYVCGDCEYFDGSGGREIATITNADHIRSMSDEDLADLLIRLCGNANSCDDCSLYGQGVCPETQSEFEWFDWLQQPYKENEDDR